MNIDLNLTAPVVLTNTFLNLFQNYSGFQIIVNISSGVADHPKAHWSVYSATKAGLKKYTETLVQEYNLNQKIKMISFNPGVMDTDMQLTIRSQTLEHFPDVDRFKKLKNEGALLSAKQVAKVLFDHIENLDLVQSEDLSIQDLLRKK